MAKSKTFWLCFLPLCLSTFLSSLDVTAIPTTLPSIDKELSGSSNSVWVGSAFSIANTAFIPLSGNLSDIFGRRPVMLLCLFLFALGSGLSGGAQSLEWLIAARVVQGLGGGGLISLTAIITSDLVPLAERGAYQGLVMLVWAIGSGLGPVVGGAFSQNVTWRWLFYFNLPVSGVVFVVVLLFLRVKTPEGTLQSKVAAIDWIGNFIIIAGIVLTNIALSWAGVEHSWGDPHVVATLVLGLVLIVAFVLYETFIPPAKPVMPWSIINNRTSAGAFIGTFLYGLVMMSIIYCLPLYFQAVLKASPLRSGVEFLPSALSFSFIAIVSGVTVRASKKYLPMNYVGWVMTIVGMGVLSLVDTTPTTAQWVGYQILPCAGIGILATSTVFPALAPLPIHSVAPALALVTFLRIFAQSWGITISTTIIQNSLRKKLAPDVLAAIPPHVDLAYFLVQLIPTLAEPTREETKVAFTESLSLMFKAMVAFAGPGFFLTVLMKEIPMHGVTDEKYALQAKQVEEVEEVEEVEGKTGSEKQSSEDSGSAKKESSNV
ncbi:MFS multidrug transporter [Flagelloscypha sp. PMI_526]|nr:MFS multidrug transporter [Flagelloscypha sp. PMI_526]